MAVTVRGASDEDVSAAVESSPISSRATAGVGQFRRFCVGQSGCKSALPATDVRPENTAFRGMFPADIAIQQESGDAGRHGFLPPAQLGQISIWMAYLF